MMFSRTEWFRKIRSMFFNYQYWRKNTTNVFTQKPILSSLKSYLFGHWLFQVPSEIKHLNFGTSVPSFGLPMAGWAYLDQMLVQEFVYESHHGWCKIYIVNQKLNERKRSNLKSIFYFFAFLILILTSFFNLNFLKTFTLIFF